MKEKVSLSKKEINKVKKFGELLECKTPYKDKELDLFKYEVEVNKICLNIFRNHFLPYISENPGCLQASLKNFFPDEVKKILYRRVATFFYEMAEWKMIYRKKDGSTYRLYLKDDIDEIKNYLTNYVQNRSVHEGYNVSDLPKEKIRQTRRAKQVEIEVYNFEDSDKRIVDYFGKKNIKILFSIEWKSWWEKGHFKNLPDNEEVITRQKKYEYKRLTSSIGGCLKFDFNRPLKKIIDKYWTKEIEIEFKKYLLRYGFFSDESFHRKIPEIIGEKRYENFLWELSENADKFEIKWCGYHWSTIREYHIAWNYLQSLKFKWGLKPKIVVKRCKKCGKKFIPSYNLRYIIEKIDQYNPHIEHINDVDFCADHALGEWEYKGKEWNAKIDKHKMEKLLKKLVEIVGIIPPSNFKEDLSYLRGLSKKNYDEAIKTLCDMPPYSAQYYTRSKERKKRLYKDVFGSWFKALIAAGVLETDARKMSRGYMCLAKDGHECLSMGEKSIDDWLYDHEIEHEKEPEYPGESNFRGDWKVGEYFIEYWGLKGQEDYDNKILVKREIAKKHEIKLIEINPDDINNLGRKINVLLKNN